MNGKNAVPEKVSPVALATQQVACKKYNKRDFFSKMKKLFTKSNRQNNFLSRASGEQLHRELYGKATPGTLRVATSTCPSNICEPTVKIPFFMLMKWAEGALTKKFIFELLNGCGKVK